MRGSRKDSVGYLAKMRLQCLALGLVSAALLTSMTRADEDSSEDVDWLMQVTRDLPRAERVLTEREQALAFINVNTRSRLQPLVGNGTPHEGFSLWSERPNPSRFDRRDPLFVDPLQPLLNPIRNIQAAAGLYAGTRFDLYESLVFQGVTDNRPGTRSTAGSNRFNVRMDTKLLEWEDRSHTQFTVQWRSSQVLPSETRSLAFSVGSPDGLDAQRSLFETRLNRLILAQGFLEDRLTVSLGKINPNDYMGLNLFASDETSQFLNTALDGNSVLPVGFQGYTEGAAFQFLPLDWLYVNGVLSSASGARGAYFQDAFRKGYFGGIEGGLILHPLGRPLRLSASWGATNANDATIDGGPTVFGNAWTGIAQWLAAEDLGAWLQVAVADRAVALSSTSQGMAGLTIENAFGRHGDGFGLGGGWSVPLDASLRTQGLVESFYRLQVTGSIQITFDAQLLVPPGSPAISDVVLAGAIRAKFSF
jgi:carbohydrate-selective porin OprB